MDKNTLLITPVNYSRRLALTSISPGKNDSCSPTAQIIPSSSLLECHQILHLDLPIADRDTNLYSAGVPLPSTELSNLGRYFEQTKSSQERAIQLSSTLNSAGVPLPTKELSNSDVCHRSMLWIYWFLVLLFFVFYRVC